MSFGPRYPPYYQGLSNHVMSQYENSTTNANQPRFFRSYDVRNNLHVSNYVEPFTQPVWDTFNSFNSNNYTEDHRFGGTRQTSQYFSFEGHQNVQSVSSYTSNQGNNSRFSHYSSDVWEKTKKNKQNKSPLRENPTLKRKVSSNEPLQQPSKVVVKQTQQSGSERQPQFNGSLQVTIQCSNNNKQSSSSSVSNQEGSGGVRNSPYFCVVCSISFVEETDYYSHLQGTFHLEQLQRFQEIHEKKTSHLKTKTEAVVASKQNDPRIQKVQIPKTVERTTFCQICKTSYTGGLIEHRQTSSHKANKVRTRPYCAQCNMFLRSPAKFVLHCNSPSHKANRNKVKVASIVQVTNDAIVKGLPSEDKVEVTDKGSKEAKNEKSKEPAEENKDPITCDENIRDCNETVSNCAFETAVTAKLSSECKKEITHQEVECNLDCDEPTIQPIGVTYIHPVKGFYCEICCKLFRDKYTARVVHCQSKLHRDNYKKVQKEVKRKQNTGEEGRSEDNRSPFPDMFIVWDDSEVDINKDGVENSEGIPFNELNNYK